MLKITIIDEEESKVLLDEKIISLIAVTSDGKGHGDGLTYLHSSPVHMAEMISNLLRMIDDIADRSPETASLLLAERILKKMKKAGNGKDE